MKTNIDTDKYEGHTPADAWRHADGSVNYMPPMNNKADVELIADAPLLLEEIKWLHEQFKLAYDWVDMQFPDGGMADFAKYIGDVIE